MRHRQQPAAAVYKPRATEHTAAEHAEERRAIKVGVELDNTVVVVVSDQQRALGCEAHAAKEEAQLPVAAAAPPPQRLHVQPGVQVKHF